MPATSIFMSALSAGISGIGYSRISVLLGPVRTAANTFSTLNEREFLMLQPSPSRADAAAQVKRWTRERFGLKVTVFVTEVESATPGFPPLHTVVAFWSRTQRTPQRTLPLHGLQAAGGGARRRYAAGLVPRRVGRDRRGAVHLLLN